MEKLATRYGSGLVYYAVYNTVWKPAPYHETKMIAGPVCSEVWEGNDDSVSLTSYNNKGCTLASLYSALSRSASNALPLPVRRR